MKMMIQRLIAILLLVIPGLGAAYGFLLMKDSLYDYFAQVGGLDLITPEFTWGRFSIGAVLFLLGIAFIGGWTFFRDRKHNYLSSRFRPKSPPRPPRGESDRSHENNTNG